MAVVEHRPEEVIECWIARITADSGGDQFGDLHIDKICPDWKDRGVWIEGGIEAFHIAVGARNRHNIPFSVCLGFSLCSVKSLTGVNFRTKQELYTQLDWSPPSLYLFRDGDEPHNQSVSARVQVLSPEILGTIDDLRCYYLEFKQQDTDEYFRSVLVEG